jgi:LuxR family maltose regulon positive regulatory protein
MLLRQFRLAAELSQDALAERAHMSARGISDLERGVRTKPYPGTVAQLADALGLDTGERQALDDAARRARDPPIDPSQQEVVRETGALLTTKLAIPPPRTQLIARPRLLDRLEEGQQGPLTLLAAPAGAGKTTLLSAWLAGPTLAGRRVGWVSLDERDNDAFRFWRYVLATLEAAGIDIGTVFLNLLKPPEPAPIEVVLTRLLNALSTRSDDLIPVLDDYHTIGNETIHRGVTFLLEHLPPRLHLVIATRTDPPLPLARLRAGGLITEVRIDDLRFSREEAAVFLIDVMGLELTPEEIGALERRTEGWIAGLQLAALSLQGRTGTATSDFISTFAGSHRHVIDYLTDEVLVRLPEPVQRFLLYTSILDRLSASLCAFVMDEEPTLEAEAASGDLLEDLERSNLFLVALDEHREWYRYHHLFAEALRHRFGRLEPDCVPEVHARASRWLEEHGFFQEAIEHTLAADAFERAADLIERAERLLFEQNGNETLWRLLNALPDDVMARHPGLCVTRAWFLLDGGHLDAGERWLDVAEDTLRSHADRDTDRNLRGELAAARAFATSYRGDVERVLALSREALRDLNQDNLLTRELAYLALGRAHMAEGELVQAAESYAFAASLAHRTGNAYDVVRAMFGHSQMERAQGKLRSATEICQQAIVWSAERGHPYPGVGILFAARADVLREWNDLDAALRLAREGVQLCRQVKYELDVDTHVFSLVTLARIEQAHGRADTALDIVHQTKELVDTTESRLPQAMLRAYEDQLWLARDNLSAALACAETALSDDHLTRFRFDLDFFNLGHELVSVLPIQLLIARAGAGEGAAALRQALVLLQQEAERANASRLVWLQLKTRILESLAYHALRDMERAPVPLEETLALGQPEEYVRVFADEGAPMAALLREVAVDGTRRQYVATLLAAIQPAR